MPTNNEILDAYKIIRAGYLDISYGILDMKKKLKKIRSMEREKMDLIVMLEQTKMANEKSE